MAQDHQSADAVIKGAHMVNVCTAEIQEDVDVAISEGRVAYIGQADHCVEPDTEVIDATGSCMPAQGTVPCVTKQAAVILRSTHRTVPCVIRGRKPS